MYITITKQHQGEHFRGSVRDFVEYLEKENEGRDMGFQEHFFDQYNDRVSPETVIKDIDGNTAKLSKKDPKFYSLVVSPSARELGHIRNDPEKLKIYVRELMKDYAASFYNNRTITVDDIKYYAKLEHTRTYKGSDIQIRENQPFATKILELKKDIRKMEQGVLNGNIKKLEKEILRLEKQAPHQQDGKRIVRGMQKEGYQSHVHIIVSRRDMTNGFSLSPGSKYKASEAILNGERLKRGFHREQFFKAAEKTFDRTFGYGRNFVESYKARKAFLKDPKRYFSMLTQLPTDEKAVAFKLLQKSGVKTAMLNIPANKVQLAFKVFMKLKRGTEKAIGSGSIGI